MKLLVAVLAFAFLYPLAKSQTSEGTLPFEVDGETFQTYYKAVGPLSSGVPLVTLHGGPGNTHHYLQSLSDLASGGKRAVVFFDQLGNGNSTHLPNKPASFWTPELFMKQVASVVSGLGIADRYDLLGHSWGGMLASQFVSQYSGQEVHGLRRLVLHSAPSSIPLLVQSVDKLVKQLPQYVQDALRRNIEAGTLNSDEYQNALRVFYRNFVIRLSPIPQDLQTSLAWLARDPTVYSVTNGPDELNINGTLKDWTIISSIPNVKVPTLLVSGKYDEVQPEAMQPFKDNLPNLDSWTIFDNSSHAAHLEQREQYMQVVGAFLDKN